ncbi:hypothetical protein NCS52_00695200 [Fusarium sp. LHS14.1]|nr:hypothetical protein NCS52_00695200 [Fusarium sp. LHS14.1]
MSLSGTDSGPAGAQAVSGVTRSRPYIGRRGQFKRSRNGCLTCRSRRKKCNEERPRCIGCRRNYLECNWPMEQDHQTSPASPRHQDPSQVPSQDSLTSPSNEVVVSRAAEAEKQMKESLWTISFGSFTHLTRSYTLTPESPLLLQHYLTTTATMLPMPANKNAFITEIIPAASVDDLLMHSVLVVSGAHMNFEDDLDGAAQKATLCHYSSLIRLLRVEFSELQASDIKKLVRLLLILVILCHFEAISGVNGGALFRHLRASREIILKILRYQESAPLGHDLKTHFGLGLELYSYLIVTNCLTPYGLLTERTFPLDPFITSLDSLSSYQTFGIMFAGLHGLFELIPQASLLFSQRLTEQEAGVDEPSPGCVELHDTIQRRLQDWNVSQAATHSFYDKDSMTHVSEAIRHSLEIYLIAAMQGSSISSPGAISQFQTHVEIFFGSGRKLHQSQWTATLMWPSLIAGSCTTRHDQQQSLSRTLRNSRYRMKHSIRASNLLQKLWDDTDPRMYGPYGLYLAISQHDLTFGTL